MLVDYTLDTKEDEILPRSLELRKRIAGRRIARGVETGIIDQDVLLKLKKVSVNEIKEHRRSNIDVLNAESGLRQTQERATQQLDIEGKLHLLDRDLQRASRLSRTRLDALTDIEKRIFDLRKNLTSHPVIPTVSEQISKDLRVNNSQRLDSMFTSCDRCNRKILTELFKAHSEACEKLQGITGPTHSARPPVFDFEQDIKTSYTTFVPQNPRNFKFVKRGCSYIDFVWDPPVFDGGLPVIEYEIDFKKQIDIFDKATKLWIRRIENMEPVITSMWCMKNPICHRGYRLKNLTAGCTYVDFKLRCKNLRGYGEYTNLSNESSIRLEEPDAPTKPLFFQTDKMTSSCMHLSWSPPIFDGGVPISGYRISYTVLERLFLATSSTKVVKKPNTVKVNMATNRYMTYMIPS
jgi:hypothetical protein